MYRINLENAERYNQLKNLIEQLTAEKDAIRADFINQLKAEGTDKKTVGNGKMTVKLTAREERRFNQERFGKDFPDLLKEYKDPTPKEILTVK